MTTETEQNSDYTRYKKQLYSSAVADPEYFYNLRTIVRDKLMDKYNVTINYDFVYSLLTQGVVPGGYGFSNHIIRDANDQALNLCVPLPMVNAVCFETSEVMFGAIEKIVELLIPLDYNDLVNDTEK